MTDEHDLAAVAKAIIDANLYMVLGTADEAGRPWVSRLVGPGFRRSTTRRRITGSSSGCQNRTPVTLGISNGAAR